MALFLSRSIHKVDKKGRVSVPHGFRTVLGGAMDEGLALNVPLSGLACIEAYPFAKLEERIARIDRLNPDAADTQAVAYQWFGSMHVATFDGEGRIVLPDFLMDHASISDSATFVGMGRYFTIWDGKTLAEHDPVARAQARESIDRVPLAGQGAGTERRE